MEISEQQLIFQVLRTAPSKRVLDLGCGSGEQARFIASEGYDVVAIDASEAALDEARARPVPVNLEFVQADLGAVERIGRGHFGSAFCLGNTLSYLLSAESISRLFIGLRRRLLPSAPLLIQVLNYQRVLAKGTEVRSRLKGDTVHVELVEPVEAIESGQEGIMRHTIVSLRYRPEKVPSVVHVDTKAFHLRGWTHSELVISLKVARFSVHDLYGDMTGSRFDPTSSAELVMVVA